MTDKKAQKNTRNTNPREVAVEEAHPQRISVAKQRDKLSVKGQDPSRHYHWILDKDDGQRIYSLELAGYRIETDQTLKIGVRKMSDTGDIGTPHRKFASVNAAGETMYMYLMSQKMEHYLEDQREKHKAIDSAESGQALVEEGFYNVDTRITDDTAS